MTAAKFRGFSRPVPPLTLTVAELVALAPGTDLGHTAWRRLTQQEVDAFAELTGDRNPVHVDPAFAATTRFGGTIAHGYFGLALLAPVFEQLLDVRGASLSLNYGLDRVRFPAPLPVGAEYRGAGRVEAVEPIEAGAQLKLALALEVRGGERPAVAAECLSRFYA
ncbi:MAG TPA: MaoC family dehydratase [Solirubrobacterales bacterium]|nr:MaoC family dehydratase [Solirubrobacterales bacterium]